MHPRQRFPVQCLGLFFPAELLFILKNRLHSSMSYGFAVIDGSNFYSAWEAFSKTKAGAVRRDWLPRVYIMFPLFSYLCSYTLLSCSDHDLERWPLLIFSSISGGGGLSLLKVKHFLSTAKFPGNRTGNRNNYSNAACFAKTGYFSFRLSPKINICLVVLFSFAWIFSL